MFLYTEGTRSVVVPGELFELQQNACEVFAKMPQRKPSPPERTAIEGMLEKEAELDDKNDEDGEELFFAQQITSCLPLASMAQKKLFWPKEAEMGPIDPNPDTDMEEERRRRRRRKKKSEERRKCMALN